MPDSQLLEEEKGFLQMIPRQQLAAEVTKLVLEGVQKKGHVAYSDVRNPP